MGRKKKKNNIKNLIFFVFIILMMFVSIEFNQEIKNLFNFKINEYESYFNKDLEDVVVEIEYSNSIKIASWNIQNFGQSKVSKEYVIKEIGNILNSYDIIAIQEITNVHEKVDSDCDRNSESIYHNNFGLIRNTLEGILDENYKLILSPQVYNERYLYVYDSSKVELVDSYFVDDNNLDQRCQTNRDEAGKMLREPYVGVFQVNNINITLMNVHTSPSNNHEELMALKYFYDIELEKHENLLLLGDLNFGCSYYPDFNMFNNSVFIFGDDVNTNVASSECAYDRMIYDEPFIGDFVNYGIDNNISSDISDHYLIWTELAFE